MKCPCCNSEIEDPIDVDMLLQIPLSVMERSLIRVLRDCYPRGMSTQAAINALMPYGSHYKSEQGSLGVFIYGVRKKLEPYGWTIPRNRPRNAIFRLAKIQ